MGARENLFRIKVFFGIKMFPNQIALYRIKTFWIKKSVICKWINTVFFVLGMVMFIPNLAMFIEQGVMGVISAVQVLMQAYAIYLLFNADSKAWFASKKLADS